MLLNYLWDHISIFVVVVVYFSAELVNVNAGLGYNKYSVGEDNIPKWDLIDNTSIYKVEVNIGLQILSIFYLHLRI